MYIPLYIYIYRAKLGHSLTFGGQCVCVCIYIHTHCPPKVRECPRKVGFWTILTWILINWWSFCTDKGQHKLRKYILLHSLYIEKLTYPIHQIIHHWQLLQLCIFWASELSFYSNVDLIYYSKPPEGLPKDDSDWLDTSYDITVQLLVAQLGWGQVIGAAIPWQTWCQLTVSSPKRICAWKCDIVQNHTLPGMFPNFWRV